MLAALDAQAFADAIARRPLRFRHDLLGRPEVGRERLAEVVDLLPDRWVYAHEAQDDPHEGRGAEPVIDRRALGATIRAIDRARASIRVYNLERAAAYAPFAREVENRIRELVGDAEGGLHAINLGLFVASPEAVTPAHPDRHHNLLLQVEGPKEIWLDDEPDRRRHHLRVLDYLECPPMGVPELPPAESFLLEPGDGCYIPPYAFHWTRLGDAPGVALSIGFSTPATLRASDAHDFDLRLRRRGRRPRPADPESTTTRVKARLERHRRHTRPGSATRVSVAGDPGGAG